MGEVEVEEIKRKDRRGEKEERKDKFDIRLGPEPWSRYEPLSLSVDGQH